MTRPVTLQPDTVLWATGYLRTQLAGRPEPYASGVLVASRVPDPRHDRMVIVRRDGGPRLDVIRRQNRLAVRVWAKDEAETAQLAELVSALLVQAADHQPVLRITELTGPSPTDDLDTGLPISYALYEAVTRGQAFT